MATFLAFYRGKTIEVEASSAYAAQTKAATALKARKSYEITVKVVSRDDGTAVAHDTASL